jgi:hypothetical protein
MYFSIINKKAIGVITISFLFYGCVGSEIKAPVKQNGAKAVSPYRLSLEVLGEIQSKTSSNSKNSYRLGDAVECYQNRKNGNTCKDEESIISKITDNNILMKFENINSGSNIKEGLLKEIAMYELSKNVKSKKTKSKITDIQIKKLQADLNTTKYFLYSPIRYFHVDEIRNTSSNTKIDTINLQNLNDILPDPEGRSILYKSNLN